jgi:hypothetical protein
VKYLWTPLILTSELILFLLGGLKSAPT